MLAVTSDNEVFAWGNGDNGTFLTLLCERLVSIFPVCPCRFRKCVILSGGDPPGVVAFMHFAGSLRSLEKYGKVW